jgi:hypothetical protein
LSDRLRRDIDLYLGEDQEKQSLHALVALDKQHRFNYLSEAPFLEVRLPTADLYALPYLHLLSASVRFDPRPCLELHFVTHRVRIYGRNLQGALPLFVLRAVTSVEISQGRDPARLGVWVERIEIKPTTE